VSVARAGINTAMIMLEVKEILGVRVKVMVGPNANTSACHKLIHVSQCTSSTTLRIIIIEVHTCV
jgi:hypothetical protein